MTTIFRKIFLFFVLFLAISFFVFSQNIEDAEKVFFDYMDNLYNAKYEDAFSNILPNDLIEYKNGIVPIFLKLYDSGHVELIQIANSILSSEGENIKPETLMKNIMENSPNIKILQAMDPKISIFNCYYNDDNNLVIEYEMIINESHMTLKDYVILTFYNERWYLKINNINSTVEQLEKLIKSIIIYY